MPPAGLTGWDIFREAGSSDCPMAAVIVWGACTVVRSRRTGGACSSMVRADRS